MYHLVTVIKFFKFFISFKCQTQCDVLISRYHLCNAVTSGIRNLHSPAHISDNTSCLQCTECDYLTHPLAAVFIYHIFNDLASSLIGKVHIYIGHGYSLGIQKPLKDKIVLDRVNIRNTQTIRYHTSCRRASSRSYRYSHTSCIIYIVPNYQKVIYITHFLYDTEFIIHSLFYLFTVFIIFRVVSFKTAPT